MSCCVPVAVQTPAHSAVGRLLSYGSELPLAPGTLVRVPLGAREVLGVVWDAPKASDVPADDAPPEAKIRPISAVLDALPPLSANWRRLVEFAAGYYQRSLGEVALAALPPQLRDLSRAQLDRRLGRAAPAKPSDVSDAIDSIVPSEEQTLALARIDAENGPFLLFGATGSGKTEVYLRAVQALLAREPAAQALVLVPEINLTPQLEARFVARFGAAAVTALHSGMTQPQRLKSWLAAHTGAARILLGTRMAVFASLPALKLIVVDEEHDPSYKQQEGARYSARDLAVYRGRVDGAKVLLGSATPSLESWHRARPAADGGRYARIDMPSRIGTGAAPPRVRLVDLQREPRGTVLAPALVAAIAERVARGEQALLLLNRRGYAPVLACPSCDWKSDCPHCSAYRVFHKIDRTLRCHHCGLAERVPRACPVCGELDIAPLGRGTERLEEHLAELLRGLARPDGRPLAIERIDADSTRHRGALEARLARVHGGDVDLLVGTQMIAKGHDFRRITLVAVVDADGALFSSDFRAPERLFSLLMQAGGRAGRDAARGAASELWVQTRQPQHPLFAALIKSDYAGFAARELQERAQAGLPPFSHQALLRAEARSQQAAQDFLQRAAEAAAGLEGADRVTLYPPVPMSLQRVAGIERAQLLLESPSRAALQRLLAAWQPLLHAARDRSITRWVIDVDPLAI